MYSLLREIDKFNDAQVRGKMFESAELVIKPGKVTVHPLPHLEGARMEDTFKEQKHKGRPEGEGALLVNVNVEDQTLRDKEEILKGWDPRKTNEADIEKISLDRKRAGFLSGSSDNSSKKTIFLSNKLGIDIKQGQKKLY